MKVVLEFAESLCCMVVSSLKSDPELKCIAPILEFLFQVTEMLLLCPAYCFSFVL